VPHPLFDSNPPPGIRVGGAAPLAALPFHHTGSMHCLHDCGFLSALSRDCKLRDNHLYFTEDLPLCTRSVP
jgi:hypothetical protein